MGARDRFVKARSAVIELYQVQAMIDAQGEDWRPENVGKSGNGDPTANKAVYNVDVWGVRLEELRAREDELLRIIGCVLKDIEAVREGLGDDYAEILDQRYIDCLPWSKVEVNGKRVKLSTGKKKCVVAFSWLDER